MLTKKSAVLVSACVAVCAFAFFLLRERPKPHAASVDDSREEASAKRVKTEQAKGAVASEKPVAGSPTDRAAMTAKSSQVNGTAGANTSRKNTQPSDRAGRMESDRDSALLAELDELLDNDDYDKLLEHAAKLIKHPNPEVRSKLAFGLHWAGLRGLADLTTMLGDPDPDVAQEALDYWKTALSDIESPEDKAALLDAAYTVTGDFTDEELLDDLLSEMLFVDDELVAAAHLREMAKQSNNPAHQQKFIEAMDSISMPDDESANIQQAINSLDKWERQEKLDRAEQAAMEIEARDAPVQKPGPARPAGTPTGTAAGPGPALP
ncbi:MAG TPA: HEAT repeat domain-containing protein [Kiritimatiellia bacterium]|nr:HEAT repeat domain-containing protein [Kiritimatiellia bacterium]HRU70387.1 HEAT repeat domain-containing protein [Kiritimatiellia bacterium]